jgi:hypothetical protein
MNYNLTEDHIEARVYSSIAEAFDKFAETIETGKSAYDEEEPAPKVDLAEKYFGPRRDVGQHIISAFTDKPEHAELTVAEIARHRSVEYGDDSPGAGAVAARLFDADGTPRTVGNVKGTLIISDAYPAGRKGAIKVA